MCGICGIHGLEKIDQPRLHLRRMNNQLQHRGPDASGEFLNDNLALGHRRLAIIDLSESANQPMKSDDGNIVLAFNGELYNFREIKSQLSDYPFKTNSDTEVVLAAWQKWGVDALRRFNGMFAFAVWNERGKELFLVRDRLGIKPLYFSRTEDSVLFASEIRAIMHSGLINKKLNTNAVVDFLRYQTVHAPQTLLHDVEMLMPGHVLHITDTEIKAFPYWSLTENTISADYPAKEVQNEVAVRLENAVKRRLIADVPFGAFLSGGIDSSLIVGLMARNSASAVKTFSVTFDEDDYSEAPYARMIAERFDTDHTEIRLTPDDFLNDLPYALAAMDHPSGDGPNTYVVSRVTRQAGVTMALSGTGGDELFAGYDIFKRVYDLQDKRWLLSFPQWARRLAGYFLRHTRPGIASEKTAHVMSADYFDLEYIYWVSRQLFFDREIAQLIHADSLPANRVFQIVGGHVQHGLPGFNLPLLSQVSVAEISTYLQNVLLRDTDQMSMAHALEVRVPFMDHELVEYVLGVPSDIKYPSSPKKLLTDAFSDLLPSEIIHRPKMGFTFPWNEWLRKDLRTFTGDHLSDLSKRTLFSKNGIEALWRAFDKGDKRVNWARIWNLVVLENWLNQNKIDA